MSSAEEWIEIAEQLPPKDEYILLCGRHGLTEMSFLGESTCNRERLLSEGYTKWKKMDQPQTVASEDVHWAWVDFLEQRGLGGAKEEPYNELMTFMVAKVWKDGYAWAQREVRRRRINIFVKTGLIAVSIPIVFVALILIMLIGLGMPVPSSLVMWFAIVIGVKGLLLFSYDVAKKL